jgi:GTP 3',8-cyclase
MQDAFGRSIEVLRISVTDRCNLACVYCADPEGLSPFAPGEILSFEEILAVATSAVAMGMRQLRLTGGEPLVRHGVVELVRMLAGIEGLEDLAMTSNGLLLERFAADLARAGLRRINVSLDSLDPQRYAEITGGGDVSRTLAGIEASRRAGLVPIKLNCVVAHSPEEAEAQRVGRFAAERGLAVQFIPRMDMRAGTFGVVERGGGGDCARCNRLRLTSNGMVRSCLFSDRDFSVRSLSARRALEEAIRHKPAAGGHCSHHAMRRIGG